MKIKKIICAVCAVLLLSLSLLMPRPMNVVKAEDVSGGSVGTLFYDIPPVVANVRIFEYGPNEVYIGNYDDTLTQNRVTINYAVGRISFLNGSAVKFGVENYFSGAGYTTLIKATRLDLLNGDYKNINLLSMTYIVLTREKINELISPYKLVDDTSNMTYPSSDYKVYGLCYTLRLQNTFMPTTDVCEINFISLTLCKTNSDSNIGVSMSIMPGSDYDGAYNTGYNNGYKDGYRGGKDDYDGSGFDSGYSKGYEKGKAAVQQINKYSFVSLINAVIYAPIKVVSSLFNVNLLGINLFTLFTGVMTFIIIVSLIRLVFKVIFG